MLGNRYLRALAAVVAVAIAAAWWLTRPQSLEGWE